eukprot:SAG31_NODE_7756_length_1602_cov_8.601999_1_plen_194_part_10
MFPVIALVGLFSLFLVFTFFKEYVTVILTVYALALGTGSTASMLKPLVAFVLPSWADRTAIKITMPDLEFINIFKSEEENKSTFESEEDGASKPTSKEDNPPETTDPIVTAPQVVEISPADVCSFLLASVFGVWFYLKEHWAANNMLGMGLAVTGIEYINLGSFQIGCILLVNSLEQLTATHASAFEKICVLLH